MESTVVGTAGNVAGNATPTVAAAANVNASRLFSKRFLGGSTSNQNRRVALELRNAGKTPDVKQTVIVLEDDSDIANLVSMHLQQAGFLVKVCKTGDTVLAMARQQLPVLFLLDVMVPGSSGFEVCKRVRESRDLAKIPIIFLTAKATEEDRVKGLELGADDYISKPFSTRELIARVNAVLRRFEQPLVANIVAPDSSPGTRSWMQYGEICLS